MKMKHMILLLLLLTFLLPMPSQIFSQSDQTVASSGEVQTARSR